MSVIDDAVEPTTQKAVWTKGPEGSLFGMLINAPHNGQWKDGRQLIELCVPGLVQAALLSDELNSVIPVEWTAEIMLIPLPYKGTLNPVFTSSVFLAYYFDVPHGMKTLQPGSGIPKEVGYLLSGYLQLGEALSFRNFENYLHGRDLKFLPFLITPEHFRFHVYLPTPERIQAAIRLFRDILDQLKGIPAHSIASAIEDAYALVRLDEMYGGRGACSVQSEVARAIRILQDKIAGQTANWPRLGIVYQHLPGPQDVFRLHFNHERCRTLL